jgi:uncharacterized repeat protein (TIGR03803 family)
MGQSEGIMRTDIDHISTAFVALLALAGTSAIASAATSLNVIYSFCQKTNCTDGNQPYGGVMLDSSGRLLGTTGFGGKYNGGTVFALTPKSGGIWKHHTLKSFCDGTPPNCQSAEGPFTTLIEDAKGNVYGTVYFGGDYGDGAVWELKPKPTGGYKLKYLYSFNGTDGWGPFELTYAGASSGALYDGKSPLYSTTIAGGTNGAGIVFSLTPNGKEWTFDTLYNFCSASGCTDGGLPYAGVIVDPSGNLLGTTEYYGANNAGVIYQLSNAGGSWKQSVLYTFCSESGCSDGNGPFAGVARDSSGNLFGTTYFGGAQNDGVVFKLSSKGAYSVLHNFCSESNCTDGSEPAAAVTLDSSGNIFGTTGRGGDGNFGTLFEIAAGTFKRVYSFCAQNGCADGGYPYGTLIFDSHGHIAGTTQYGGGKGLGDVYLLKP